MKTIILFSRLLRHQHTRVCSTALKYFTTSSKSRQENYFSNKTYPKLIIGTSVVGVFAYYFQRSRNTHIATCEKAQNNDAGEYRPDLPNYTIDEISKHTNKENGIWVTYKQGVYDVTDYLESHPGGEQILMAAGSSVEPFWMLYAVHLNGYVFEILETLRIGNVSHTEAQKFIEDMSDPYSTEPRRHPVLKPASEKPFNAEPPARLLGENFITPKEIFYVRNHLPVPVVDPKTYELEIAIEGTNKTKTFTLDELKKLPKRTIIATVMCAGNRRSEMSKVKTVKGLYWGAASIGNAVWTGVPLRDVLLLLGIDEDNEKYKHVQFEGLDTDPASNSYGGSIPFWKAIDKRGDVLIAYEMNGEPLLPDHGFPVRVIVPGVVGARNVKWLGRIIVSENENQSHWQQNDYKGFSPSVDWDTLDYSKSPAIQELPVISAICKPSENEIVTVEDGYITVKGYAWSGGGKKIVRVDVTIDGGKKWHVANFDHQDSAEPPRHWAWTLWSVKIPVSKKIKNVEIWAKAVDSSYNVQPESFENIWNVRGVLSNAYHRVPITCKHSSE